MYTFYLSPVVVYINRECDILEFMEKKIICSDAELAAAYEKFCDAMIAAQDKRLIRGSKWQRISSKEYKLILLNADAEYNKVVYGE